MRCFLLFVVIVAFAHSTFSQDFITQWSFPDATTQIQFNALTTDTVHYTWSTSPSGNSGNGSFIQTTADTVILIGLNIMAGDTVTLSMAPENLGRFYFVEEQNNRNLIDVVQWGEVPWTSMSSAFYGCSNLVITASDTPDFTLVTEMDSMFYSASLSNADIEHWDVSSVEDMSAMFFFARAFNQDIGDWDVSNVNNMYSMFYNASSFNQDIGDWSFKQNVTLGNMLDFSGMDCDHYSATLIGWQENNPTLSNVELGAAGLEYGTSAKAARDSLINVQGWTIEGDVESDMPCDELVSSGFPQVNDESHPLIYPNPAQDQIHLPVNNIPYTIINTQGVNAQNGRVEGQRIPIGNLPTGIYLLQVNDEQKLYQAKFVKE